MIDYRRLKSQRFLSSIWILAVTFVTGTLAGCGGGATTNRQLQSITISPQSAVAQNGQSPQFTASGQFNATPLTVTPLPVVFSVMGAGYDIPVLADPAPYTLSTQPMSFTCRFPATTVTVVAFASVDPNAPANGAIPQQVYFDLVVNRTTTIEDGFVAGSTEVTCP